MFKKIIISIVAVAMSAAIFASSSMAQDMDARDDVMITAISISGNFEVPDDEILSVVTSKVGEPLSTAKLEEDLQRIYDLGYFMKDVKASLSEYENGARVTFRVEENPVVTDIRFEGNTSFSSDDLMDVMNTRKNKVLNSNTLRMDIEAVESKYRDAGFLAARIINAQPESDNSITITISEGTIEAIKVEYVIKDEEDTEAIEVKDSGKTKDYVIIREMKIKPGDTYNTEVIGKDLQRVYNLGFFEEVHTRVESGSELGQVVLIVEVQEMNTGTVGFGAGYSSNTGLTGFLSLSERNLKGKGRRGDIKLEFGGKRNNYELGYFEPWLDNKQTSIEMRVYNTSQEDFAYGLSGTVYSSDYEEIRSGFNVTVGRPISDYTKVYFGLKVESINVEPDQYDYYDGDSRSITGTIRTDTRDNVFNPTSGRYDSASLEMNGRWLGGDFDYEKLVIDVRRFYEVRKKQVFGFRVRLGLSRDMSTKASVDWFDVGGVNTLRGYDEYQFSGRDMLLYNAEYRFNMSGNLSAVAFGDAGMAWEFLEDFDLNPKEMGAYSVGAGLRLKIPAFGIGPVRLDYAYAIPKQEAKIHFGFGHMF